MLDALFNRIDDQRDALIAFTQDLVRIPTVNPPGEGYEPCATLLGERLRTVSYTHLTLPTTPYV